MPDRAAALQCLRDAALSELTAAVHDPSLRPLLTADANRHLDGVLRHGGRCPEHAMAHCSDAVRLQAEHLARTANETALVRNLKVFAVLARSAARSAKTPATWTAERFAELARLLEAAAAKLNDGP